MTQENQTPQDTERRLADLTETLEREKVELSPEVEEYALAHVRAVQDKLQAGQPIFETDLEFIDMVKMWIMMPEKLREKYKSIQEMEESEEMKEAGKRHILLKQWLDLLHVAKAADKSKEWIDEKFKFEGGGKIFVEGDLELRNCTSLTTLPAGLQVGVDLFLSGCTSLTTLPADLQVGGGLFLSDCTSFTTLPADLQVGGELFLAGCTSLTTIPADLHVGLTLHLSGCTSLTTLPADLQVKRDLELRNCTSLTALPAGLQVKKDLDLMGCISLTTLPAGLKVGWSLNLIGCTSLTTLPGSLEVGQYLFLSHDLNNQVKEDAERLKKEGKIKEKIFV
jgi:hypothetical protein